MAKSTKKNTKNKSGLMRRFDLSNKRVQFFTVIALVAILGGGFFLVRSFAATTGYSNGKIYAYDYDIKTYSTPTSQPTTTQKGETTEAMLKRLFPNNCDGVTGGDAPPQTWSPDNRVVYCYNTFEQQVVQSMISISYGSNNPKIIKQDNISLSGTNTDNGHRYIADEAFIKDGSMSKIAFSESVGKGGYADRKIGIYDTATKRTTYLKDVTGQDLKTGYTLKLDWTPDNTQLKYLQNSEYKDGFWRFQVCTVSVNGGNPQCEATMPSQPNGTLQPTIIWSYDLSKLYTSYVFPNIPDKMTIVSYDLNNKTASQLLSNKHYYLDLISPDSRYLIITDWDNKKRISYDTVQKIAQNTTIPFGPDLAWRAIKKQSTPTQPPAKNPQPEPEPTPTK